MIRIEDITIDPEFRDLLPSLEDRSRLKAKIELEGWSGEEITVWQHHNILLDGHNRLAIYNEQIAEGQDVDGPPVREMKFATREAAMYWAVNNQRARRNLTKEQDDYLMGLKFTAEKKSPGGFEGNDNAKTKGKRSPENLGIVSDKPVKNPTAKRIGEEYNVSHNTVEQNEKYKDAVIALDQAGVKAKADILSGKEKLAKRHVIEAGKLAKSGKTEEAKAVLTSKPRKQEDAPTKDKPKGKSIWDRVEGTDAQRKTAVSAEDETINLLQRSPLVRLAKNNPYKDVCYTAVIRWLKERQKELKNG